MSKFTLTATELANYELMASQTAGGPVELVGIRLVYREPSGRQVAHIVLGDGMETQVQEMHDALHGVDDTSEALAHQRQLQAAINGQGQAGL